MITRYGLFHCEAIPSPVLSDLESQKVLDCRNSFCILTADRDPPAISDLFISVLNLPLEFRHGWYAGRGLVMYETGNVEVAGFESGADVAQVHTDVFNACGAVSGVCGYLNSPAVLM